MAKSLQEQLMGSGLVDKKKAKSIQKEKRNKRKQSPKGQHQIDEVKLRTEQQKKDKVEKDRELNRQQQISQQKKAVLAQIKQLILSNAVRREEGEVGFQFVVAQKIKKIYLSKEQHEHLLKGRLAISILLGEYIIVPTVVAAKVRERDEAAIVYIKETSLTEDADENDPYKDFEIPDDLMW